MGERLRNFCFTINNPTRDDREKMRNAQYQYMIWGEETGENGTFHYQGYCQLKSQQRLSTIKKSFPRAHIEPQRGTAEQAIEYCKKEGTYHERGEPKLPGKRSDIAKIKEMKSMKEVITSGANYQDIRIAEKYFTYCEPVRTTKPTVTWIHGDTGTGKSRMAQELAGPDAYWKDPSTKWWDGYDGHKTVVIDDFRDSWWPISYTLRLLDRYPLRFEFKGGYRQFVADTIIITSIRAPGDCYVKSQENIQQLTRRIDKIVCLDSKVGGNTNPSLETNEVLSDNDADELSWNNWAPTGDERQEYLAWIKRYANPNQAAPAAKAIPHLTGGNGLFDNE